MRSGVFILLLALFMSPQIFAKEKSTRGTKFEFSETDVQGRYNSSGEGLSIVEDEKSISDLLGLRKNFKDRVKNNLRVQK